MRSVMVKAKQAAPSRDGAERGGGAIVQMAGERE